MSVILFVTFIKVFFHLVSFYTSFCVGAFVMRKTYLSHIYRLCVTFSAVSLSVNPPLGAQRLLLVSQFCLLNDV